MHHIMRNPVGIKVRRCAASMIVVNKYLDVLPGSNTSDKTFETELYEILMKNMSNTWSNKAYIQGFDCESITFKSAGNILNLWK